MPQGLHAPGQRAAPLAFTSYPGPTPLGPFICKRWRGFEEQCADRAALQVPGDALRLVEQRLQQGVYVVLARVRHRRQDSQGICQWRTQIPRRCGLRVV